MIKTTRSFLLVVAPGIPMAERFALEKHFKEALRDPDFTLVVNYDLLVDLVEVADDQVLTISAPGVPTCEVTDLRKRIDKALRKKKKLRPVVANYDVRISTEAA